MRMHSPLQNTSSSDSHKSSPSSSITSGHRFSRALDSFDREDDSGSSVLVSFGVGYTGVLKDCFDHPENFILPSEGSRNHYQSARPDRSVGRLLLWSTETCVQKDSRKYGCDLAGVTEEEEILLPDHLITGYQ